MAAERVAGRAWLIVAMLFCFMLVNFADKAVLGLSAVPIMQELGLDHTEFGLIGTSFFAFFSLSAVLVGFVVNRVSTTWVLLINPAVDRARFLGDAAREERDAALPASA